MKRSLPAILFPFLCLTAFAGPDSMRFSLYYETAEYLVTPVHRDSLKKWLDHLEEKLELKHIIVLSYCDDVGTDFYNDSLSTKRAQHTWQALKELSFGNETLMWVQGMGEVILNLREDHEKQRQYNRRTDIWVYYTPKSTEKTVQLAELDVGQKVAFSTILFVPGTRRLLPESTPALDSLYLTLKNNPNLKIRIIGYVCCRPVGMDGPDIETGEENLSVIRAKAVYEYLVTKGISEKRLAYTGAGSQPTGLGDKADRRVEVEIIAK